MTTLAIALGSFATLWMIVAWLACGLLAGHVAAEKDRCGFCWFCLGIVLGPLALIAAAGLPDNRRIIPLFGKEALPLDADKEPAALGAAVGFVRKGRPGLKEPPAWISVTILAVIVLFIASRYY